MSLAHLRTMLRGSSSGRSSEDASPQSIPSSPSFSDFAAGAEADYRHTVINDASSGGPNPFDVNNFSSLHRGSLDTARAQVDAPYSASGVGSLWGRLSMDGSSPRKSAGGRPLLSTASMAYPASPSFHSRHSPAMAIPQLHPASGDAPAADAGFAQTCPSGDAAEPLHRRGGGRPEGKIDGMDYYGWCELLRSSSL